MNAKIQVIVFHLFLFMFIAFLAGCAGMGGTFGKTEEMADTTENQFIDETELQLLADVFGDGQRLPAGRLYSYEKEALGQLRAGERYLQGRYGGYSFLLESFSPASRARPWAELFFKYGGELFMVKIIPSEDMASFSCEDNFYGCLIREEYDDMIEQVLAQAGCTARSYTRFLSTIRYEMDPDASADEVLRHDAKLSRDTHLFTEGKGPEDDEAEIIQDAIKNAGIYGNYWIYFTDGDIEGDVRELEGRKDEWESSCFCCFGMD